MKFRLINCMVASDGGSITLYFTTEVNEEYWVSLDKGIYSSTKNKIFSSDHGELPLSLEQEKELLLYLESAHIDETGCDKLLQKVVSEIKNR